MILGFVTKSHALNVETSGTTKLLKISRHGIGFLIFINFKLSLQVNEVSNDQVTFQ
jgi:hypothetical protein